MSRGFTGTIIAVLACMLILSIQGEKANARSINDALGKTSFTWLKSVSDAGVSASGECIAARDGYTGLLVHPAAIAGIEEGMAKLSYVSHYVDTQYGSVGYAGNYKGRSLGLRVSYVNYGEFIHTDKQGERTGTFTAGDIGLSLNMGKMIRDDLKVGATASIMTSKIEEFTAQAAAVDLGVIYYPPFEGLAVGATLMNIGAVTKSYSSGYNDSLPVMLNVGGRKELSHAPITLMADIIFPNDNDIVYAFGLEASIRDVFFLYAGTKSRNIVDMDARKSETDYSGRTTFGFGLLLKRYRFNYAFCPDVEIEDIHKITLGVRIR